MYAFVMTKVNKKCGYRIE